MFVQYRARKRAFSLIFIMLLIISFTFIMGTSVLGMKPFPIKEYVTDQAGLLPDNERIQMAAQLGEYAKATGNQILIVTIPSLENEDLNDFTVKLFDLNKPGTKEKDTGVLILCALKERKIRIEVGYGLEGVLPDGKAGEIIREQIQPGFKAGDYYGGFAAGVNSIISTITPDYKSGYSGSTSQNKNRDQSFPFAFIVAIIIFIFSFLGNINRGARNHHRRNQRGFSEPWFWGGGGFGGGSGGGFSGGGFSGGGGGFSGGGGSSGGGGASGGW